MSGPHRGSGETDPPGGPSAAGGSAGHGSRARQAEERRRRRRCEAVGHDWLLHRQRAAIPASQPLPGGGAVSLSAILPSILDEARAAEALWPDILRSNWASIVGDPVAAHTRPGPLSGGTLVVYVDHSMWLGELERSGRRPILDNIRRAMRVDTIRRVRLMLDPDRAPPPRRFGARREGGAPP
jgi:predicted nucleic acid-binding Zn ribbon protein